MLRFLLSTNLLHIFVDKFSNHDLSYYCCMWHLWLLINSNLLIIFYFSCSLSNWKMLTVIFHVSQMIWLLISNLCQVVLHDFLTAGWNDLWENEFDLSEKIEPTFFENFNEKILRLQICFNDFSSRFINCYRCECWSVKWQKLMIFWPICFFYKIV